METHLQELEQRIRVSGEPLEGNCFYIHQSMDRTPILQSKQQNFTNLMTHISNTVPRPNVCEIGMNAGHSLMLLLDACKSPLDVLVFDLGEHGYTRPCLDYLKSQYLHASIQCIFGTSLVTLPYWLSKHPETSGTFDLVHVDGGHSIECIANDMGCAIQLAKPGRYIIVDDCDNTNIIQICELWILQGIVKPIPQLYSIRYPHILLQKTSVELDFILK